MRFVCLILLTAILSLCGCLPYTSEHLTFREVDTLRWEMEYNSEYETSYFFRIEKQNEFDNWFKSLTPEQKAIVDNDTRPPRYEIIGIELDKHSANYGEFKYGFVGGTSSELLMHKYRPIFEPGFDWDVYEKEQYQKWYDSLRNDRQIFINQEIAKEKAKWDRYHGLKSDGTSSYKTNFEKLMEKYKWKWFFEDNIK